MQPRILTRNIIFLKRRSTCHTLTWLVLIFRLMAMAAHTLISYLLLVIIIYPNTGQYSTVQSRNAFNTYRSVRSFLRTLTFTLKSDSCGAQ